MHWFVADETNKDSSQGEFFIYGGLVFTEEQIPLVHAAVDAIRLKYGYQPGDDFKFHTRARPSQVTIDSARLAKQELVEALKAIGVRMIVYVVLHDIATNRTEVERMNYALDTVSWAYHRLLDMERTDGVMLIDRDDDQHNHLAHLFQHGIAVGGKQVSVRDRIRFFGQTSNNASHLSSAVDVALGAFRYCANAAGGVGSDEVARAIFSPLSELLWGVGTDPKQVGGHGFIARPIEVHAPAFDVRYTQLRTALTTYSRVNVENDPTVDQPE